MFIHVIGISLCWDIIVFTYFKLIFMDCFNDDVGCECPCLDPYLKVDLLERKHELMYF